MAGSYGRIWPGDPALDPQLWENAGGNATITLTAALRDIRNKIASVKLPRPMCVAVQMGIEGRLGGGIADNAGGAVMGTRTSTLCEVQWQSGRGTHRVLIDAGQGTTFTLAAAQAVNVNARLVNNAGSELDSVTFQCTMAPAMTQNPLPAYFTLHLQTVSAAGASGNLFMPAFARRVVVTCANATTRAGLTVEFRENAGTTIAQYLANDANILIPANATRVNVSNPTASDALLVQVRFELVL